MKRDDIKLPQEGDPISAGQFRKVIQAIKSAPGASAGFFSNALNITRKVGLSTGGSGVLMESCDGLHRDVFEDVETPSDGPLSENVGFVVTVQDDDTQEIRDYKILAEKAVKGLDNITILARKPNCGTAQCYRLTRCDAGGPDIVTSNQAIAAFSVVRLTDGFCYTVTPETNCSGATADPFLAGFDSCDQCDVHVLTDCYGSNNKRVASTPFFVANVGNILRGDDGVCRAIGPVIDGDGSPLDEETSTTTFGSCDACTCYRLTVCEGGSVVLVRPIPGQNMTTLIGKTILATWTGQSTEVCAKVSESTGGDDCSTAVDAVLINVYDRCLNEAGTFDHACAVYDLRTISNDNCSSPGTTITVGDPNGEWAGHWRDNRNSWFKRAEDEMCYEILDRSTASLETGLSDFTVEEVYDTCDECQQPQYRLIDDCAGPGTCTQCDDEDENNGEDPPDPEDDQITDEDLLEAVGKYIKIGGKYWKVEQNTPPTTVDRPAPLSWTGPFDQCNSPSQEPSCIEVITDIDFGAWTITKTKFLMNATECDTETIDIDNFNCDTQ